MGIRCEMCDDWLSMFQLSKLCDTCYKTRTIIKAYSAVSILKSLEDNFLIDNLPKLVVTDEKGLKKPDGYKNLNSSDTLKKIADDQVDYYKPETRNNKKTKM